MSNIERKMAVVVKIDDVIKHPDADTLDICTIGGWKCVTRLGEFKKDDLVVYVAIDSWVPTEIAPFLSKGKEPREYEGIKGERLRTAKLRGVVSQGLILPFNIIMSNVERECSSVDWNLGDDVSEILNIKKYEPPLSAALCGLARGNFPSWGRKTDQERCQNIVREIQKAYDDDVRFEVSVKLDGSSMSIGHNDGELVVCSRNLSLKLDQEGNSFVDMAKKLDIFDKITYRNMMISGELIGSGINGNHEQINHHEYHVFDIWDVDKQCYLPSEERLKIVDLLGLEHVPILYQSVTLRQLELDTIDKILKYAEGASLYVEDREGIVFKSIDGSFSFKAISNSYLLKHE